MASIVALNDGLSDSGAGQRLGITFTDIIDPTRTIAGAAHRAMIPARKPLRSIISPDPPYESRPYGSRFSPTDLSPCQPLSSGRPYYQLSPVRRNRGFECGQPHIR